MPLERITGPIAKRGGSLTISALAKVGFGIESKPGTVPVTVGADTIAIGDGASANGARSVSIGANADAGSVGSISIGDSADVGLTTAVDAIAIGSDSIVHPLSIGAMAIGQWSEATGEGTICIGFQATADGAESTLVGKWAISPGVQSVALGYAADSGSANSIAIGPDSDVGATTSVGSIAIGYAAIVPVDAPSAIAIGVSATARGAGDVCFGFGNANAQHHLVPQYIQTADATPVAMNDADGSAGFPIAAETTYAIQGVLVARTAGDLSAHYTFDALVSRTGATTTLVDSTISELFDATAGVSAALGINDTNDTFEITVTGIAATDIRWAASMHMVEIKF